MKKSLWIGGATVAALLVVGTVRLWLRPAAPQSAVALEPSTSAARAMPANTTPVAVAPLMAPTRPPAVVEKSAVTFVSGSGDAAVFRIKAGAVLATVNGAPIELKDLLPLPAGKEITEQIMSAERYTFLLDRTVDRELTLQQARAQGVDLTDEQRALLAQLRARREAPQANVFDTLQANPANADFEARDAAALLLQASLAKMAGTPSRDVTAAQVEQYYQAHKAEYGALPSDAAGRPAAWEKIDGDIRVKLGGPAQALHDQSLQEFVVQLRASAQIVKTTPTS